MPFKLDNQWYLVHGDHNFIDGPATVVFRVDKKPLLLALAHSTGWYMDNTHLFTLPYKALPVNEADFSNEWEKLVNTIQKALLLR